MLSMQQGAKKLFSDNPDGFYFFTGPEYGVKKQYLDKIAQHYDGNVEEYQTFDDVVSVLSKKSLIPRKPSLYIVKYDKSFLSSKTSLSTLKFRGMLVGTYELDTSEAKLDKKYPEHVLRFNHLTPSQVFKHLSKSYPNIPTGCVETISKMHIDFYEAQTMCKSMSYLDDRVLQELTPKDIVHLFDYKSTYKTEQFKVAVVSRSYRSAIKCLDSYDGDIGLLLYDYLSSLLELVKVFENKYADSYASKYVKLWTLTEVKELYNVVYSQVSKLRQNSTYRPENALLYCLSLLKFRIG